MDMPLLEKVLWPKCFPGITNSTFIDSGSLYRGVTFYALEKGLFENDQLDKEH